MATVFMSIVASAGVGLAVTSALAAYAQRHWKGYDRSVAVDSAASASPA